MSESEQHLVKSVSYSADLRLDGLISLVDVRIAVGDRWIMTVWIGQSGTVEAVAAVILRDLG